MRRFVTTLAIASVVMLAFIARASAADLAKILENKEGPDKFQIIHVADLVKLQADPTSHVQVFDANHPSTRDRFGIIPGAHLLSSDDNYDVAKELPADKSAKLVFYCADFK